MRLLVFTQYFPPEIGPGQTRLYTFASGLAARGWEVEVVCEVPNHPAGVVHPGYGGRLVDRRRLDGFEVAYVRVLMNPVKTPLNRLAFYGSYAAMASAVGSAARRPDAVFASSPPLPVGIPGALVARRHRRPLILDVRDLWPEAAGAIGEVSEGGRAYRALDAVARGLYREAAAITTVTEPFREAIARKAPGATIHTLPNGTTRFWLDSAELEVARSEVGLPEDRFVWAYAGNLSGVQDLATAIEAARSLGDEFHLLIVGEGPKRDELREQAAALPAGSVSFRELLPPEQAVRLLRGADALLVPHAADPVFHGFVPTKLFDYCALGRPVVLASAGEVTRLAGEADAALLVPPGDPGALAAALRRLRAEPELGSRLAEAGRAFAARNLREVQVERLAALIEDLVGSRQR